MFYHRGECLLPDVPRDLQIHLDVPLAELTGRRPLLVVFFGPVYRGEIRNGLELEWHHGRRH